MRRTFEEASGFHIASWNCANLSLKDADSWESDMLSNVHSNTIVGLQESSNLFGTSPDTADACIESEAKKRRKMLLSRPVQPALQGHELVGKATSQAAILVPLTVVPAVKWRSDRVQEFEQSSCTAGLATARVGVVSCYLFACLSECRRMCSYMRVSLNVDCLFLLCDLNLQLSAGIAGITGDHIHKLPDNSLESREFEFVRFLREFKLRAANTMRDDDHKSSVTYTGVPL